MSEDSIAAFAVGQLSTAELHVWTVHMDTCARCRRLVSALARVEALPAHGEALVAGGQLGRFVLSRPLGRGAMGEVWAAHDLELDREVALKVLRLRAGAIGAEGAARLRREAQAMARLHHANVVAIYELGADGDRGFCAMEFIDGVTLRRWLETARSWREVVEVACAVGRGIAAAHAVGLIHRDVKPENVLIARDGRALISDFGLAKLDDVAGEVAATSAATTMGALTATGALLGTPRYMAPEQLAGYAADARSDQFSFCVMVYEALYGARPFDGATIDELVRDIQRGPPRRRGVPRGVARCLARGLAVDPEARWPSMSALGDALVRAVRVRRRWRIAAGIAVVGLAMAGVAAAVMPRVDPGAEAERRIAAAWQPARQAQLEARFLAIGGPLAAERAATTTRLLDGYRAAWQAQWLDAWSATHTRGAQSAEVLERRLACLDQLAEAMAGLVDVLLSAEASDVGEAPQSVYRLEPVASCHLDRVLARSIAPSTPAGAVAEQQLRALEAIHRAGRNKEALQRAAALIEPAIALGDPAAVARARFDLGSVQAASGRFADAEPTLRLALQDAAAARDHYLVAECWLRLLSVVGHGLHRRDDALAIEPAARAAVVQAGSDPRQLADLAKTLGLVAASRGDVATAHAQFVEARARRIAARGALDPGVAADESNLGAALIDLDRSDEAAAHLARAIEILGATLGQHHQAIAGAEHNLATIAADRKDWAAAERHARAAIEANALASGPDHPGTASNRIRLARILVPQRRFAEARAELDRAASSLARSLPPTHPSRLLFDIYRAQLEDAEGHVDAAIRLARGAVAAAHGADVPVTQRMWVMSELAALLVPRAPREALQIYGDALALYTPSENPRRGDIELLRQYGELALAQHDARAGLAWFDHAPALAARLPELRDRLHRAAR